MVLIQLVTGVTPIFGFDFTVEGATLRSIANELRDVAQFGDLRTTVAEQGGAIARATYDATYTASSYKFAISSQKLTLKGGQIAVLNEGVVRFRLAEPALYSVSGTNVWSGTTREYASSRVGLHRILPEGGRETIFYELDGRLGTSGGLGVDGVMQGDPAFSHLSGVPSGYLLPGVYEIDYSFSVSDGGGDAGDNVDFNGRFSFQLTSERASVADPLTKAVGYPITSSGGNKPWGVTALTGHDGGDSARSGQIQNGEASALKTSFPGGLLVFWWKVSSQTNDDFLEVKVDGLSWRRISGEVGWQEVRLMIGPNIHEVEWVYAKGLNGSAGQDAGWVDSVRFEDISSSGERAAQTIQFDQPPAATIDGPYELVGQSSSGLAVSFQVLEGPALIRGSILVPIGSGLVRVRASQPGDGAYLPAASVERIVNVDGRPPSPLAVEVPQMTVLVGEPDGKTVEVLAVQADGKVIAGGYFHYVNGQRRWNIARFNKDGTLDREWKPEIGGRGVFDVVIRDNSLYVAGQFDRVNGVTRNSLAKLSLGEVAVLDPDWNPAPDNLVFSLAAVEDGLIVGGAFTHMGSVAQPYLAKLGFDGGGRMDTLWAPRPNNTVYELSVWQTNLYVYGAFSRIGDVSIDYLAKVSTLQAGGADAGWKSNLKKPLVQTLLATETGLYAGGNYCFGTSPDDLHGLAEFSASNGSTLALGYRDKIVTALAVRGDALFVGYGVDADRPIASHALEKVQRSGFVKDHSWHTPIISKDLRSAAGYAGKVATLAFVGGNLYAGGDFRSCSGSPGSGLAILPGFAGPPRVQDSMTSVDRLTETGIIVMPNPADELQTLFYRISEIRNGTVYDRYLQPIVEGQMVDLTEGRLGLRFRPDPGFFGTGSFKVQAANNQDSSALLSPAATATITVLERRYPQSITFEFLRDVPLSADTLEFKASASSGLPVHFMVEGPVARISENAVKLIGIGEVQVIAQQLGNEIYEPTLEVGQRFRVLPGAQTLEFLSPSEAAINLPLELKATASSGLPVRFELVSGPAVLSGNVLTFSEMGPVIVRIIQDGNDFYAPVLLEKQIIVGKPGQTILFPPVFPRAFNAGRLALNASASSGLPVSYRIISGNAVVANGFLEPKGAGIVVVEAIQEGNEQYSSARAEQEILFLRGTQSIWYEPLPKRVETKQQYQIRAGSNSGLPIILSVDSDIAQIAGDTLTVIKPGLFRILYSQAGNIDWEPAQTFSDTIQAGLASQSIDWPSIGEVAFHQSPVALTATASSGLPVRYRVLTGPVRLSEDQLILSGTGAAQIEAYQPGDGEYAAALNVVQAFTILKGTQTISWQPITNVVAGTNYFLGAAASSGLPVRFSVSSGPARMVEPYVLEVTEAGPVTLVARQEGNGNYYAVEVSQTVVASKREQFVEFEPIPDQIWNTSGINLKAVASSGLPVRFEVLSGPGSVSGSELKLAQSGLITVAARQGGNSTYAAAETVRSIRVLKAAQSIDFPEIAQVRFSDSPVQLRASSSSSLPVEYAVLAGNASVSGDQVVLSKPGGVTIEARQAGDERYEPASPIQRTFAVLKGIQSIDFAPPTTIRFKEPPLELQGKASSGLPVQFGILSGPAVLESNRITTVNVGTLTVIALQEGSDNYEAAPLVMKTITIEKALQTIDFAVPDTIVAGGGGTRLSAVSSSGLPVEFVILSGPGILNRDVLTAINAGTVTIRALQNGGPQFEAAPSVDRIIQVLEETPMLNITTGRGGEFVVSWTASSGAFQLEESRSLSSPAWTSVTIEAPTDDQYAVRLKADGQQKFFRLKTK